MSAGAVIGAPRVLLWESARRWCLRSLAPVKVQRADLAVLPIGCEFLFEGVDPRLYKLDLGAEAAVVVIALLAFPFCDACAFCGTVEGALGGCAGALEPI